MWLMAAGATLAAWFHFNHPVKIRAGSNVPKPANKITPARETPPSAPTTAVAQPSLLIHAVNAARPVQVVIRAHQPSWLQVSVDGKPTFTGTLQADETKELGAEGQVKIVAGNAGALTISLNGKTLDPLGEIGQVRVVRLTAEGPEFLSTAPPPAPDPL